MACSYAPPDSLKDSPAASSGAAGNGHAAARYAMRLRVISFYAACIAVVIGLCIVAAWRGESDWLAIVKAALIITALWSVAAVVYVSRRESRARAQSERHLRAVVETVLDGLITIDGQGMVQSFNPAAVRIFGYEPEEVIGRNVRMLMPEPYHSEHDKYLHNYLATGDARVIGIGREVSGRRKDGSVFPMELGVNEMQVGGRMFVGTVRDISQRKAAEEALRLSEERYELAVMGMSVGLWDWNVETDELYWSKQFREIVGVEDADFNPHYEEFAGRLHPDDRDATLKALAAHLDRRGPFNVTYRLRHNDGSYVWIHACGQAKWDENGKPVRMVGSVNDISARKRLEVERETFVEKLTESNSELERFAYVCSHDLQEPLRMITNFSERLERHLGEAMDDKGRHYMKYVTDGAAQARQLISDVLSYARVDHEAEQLANVDSEKALSGVLRDLSARIEETGAMITHDPLPEVYVQSTHLRQLLQNLVGNALKFCADRPHIHVGAKPEGAMWRFYVRDNGIGIAPEHMEKIFSIFQRLHSRDRYPGTGIGLALCRKLALKYGGRIWVESQPGKGSTFYFTLPSAADRRSEAA